MVQRLLERLNVRLAVREEGVEPIGQRFGPGQVRAQVFAVILIKNRLARILENDIGARLAASDLLQDFGVQIVVGVLGFPVAARKSAVVA